MRLMKCLWRRGGSREAMLIGVLAFSIAAQPVLALGIPRLVQPPVEAAAAPVSAEPVLDGPVLDIPALNTPVPALSESFVTAIEVFSDPLVHSLRASLERTGFTILPEIVVRERVEQDWILMLPIAETGGPKVPNPDDSVWTDSVRLAVQVIWSNNAAKAVIESRVTWSDENHITYMHEAFVAGQPSAKLRIVDRIVNLKAERTVDLYELNEQGQYVLSVNGGAADWNWNCVRNCLRNAGISIAIWAAVCLVGCLIVGGVAAVVSGGSAFAPVFIFCLKKCAKKALSSVGTALRNCLLGC